jgi:maleate isomerase
MYGHRARIGYTSPPFLTETFPYEFYKLVPEGVTLVLTTLAIRQLNSQEIDASVRMTLDAAREMGRAGVDLVVFGGVPLNLSLGYDGLERTMHDMEREIGVPVTSSVTAQIEALRAVGAQKVLLLHPFDDPTGQHTEYVRHYGFEVVGEASAGKTVAELAKISAHEVMELVEQQYRRHSEADTVYITAPHWGIIDIIGPLEQEHGCNVVTAIQAIVWYALRRCEIKDAIQGYGRLLRDF